MSRPTQTATRRRRRAAPGIRAAYTLVEILTATLLMVIIMLAVTVIFASVTDSIAQSRATLEMSQGLRATAAVLKQDLENVTPVMAPPRHPAADPGYFVYVEGPIGPVVDPATVAWNNELSLPDTTVGDIDDIIMFTATTKGEPYIGLINGVPTTSNSAEIIWFIRGHTLYRRVLLIRPETNVRSENPAGFYRLNDLSVRKDWDNESVPPVAPPGPPWVNAPGAPKTEFRPVLKANSLADLTRPECRFCYQPDLRAWTRNTGGATLAPAGPQQTPYPQGALLQKSNASLRYWKEPKPFPFFLRPWLGAPFDPTTPNTDITANFRWVPGLGLPILAECSAPNWRAGDFPPTENPVGIHIDDPRVVQMPQLSQLVVPDAWYDAWTNEHPWPADNPLTPAVEGVVNSLTGALLEFPGSRNDDVVLTNVIGFDVKAWDPNAAILTTTVPDQLDPNVSRVVTLLPGDPGYITACANLRNEILNNNFKNGSTVLPMPAMGAYVDLNYLARIPFGATLAYPDAVAVHSTGAVLRVPYFARPCGPRSTAVPFTLQGTRSLAYGTLPNAVAENQGYDFFPAVYDTWSVHYQYNRHTVHYFSENPTKADEYLETVGNEDGDLDTSVTPPAQIYDEGSNGFDDDRQNGVDDVGEWETEPPYAVPLQGIQISIRVFEPGSRQIREVTIVQKFRTK